MGKNTIFKYSLEEYKKRYRNRSYKLLKLTKKEVEDFDKQHSHYIINNKTYNLKLNHFLLKNKKWTLIGDTYYEIPKAPRLTWFRNLAVGVQASICLLGTAGIASAITFPTLAVKGVFNKGSHKPEPEPGPEPVSKKWYEYDDWYKRTDKATIEDVGITLKVEVNGLDHLVRLIDIDHDVDENDNKIHTTWEFANIISDSSGYSLAYQWNDTNNFSCCYDYINSTIRYALTGNGNNCGKTGEKANEILVAEKGATTWSTTYNKTILSRLPQDFRNNLKTVKKTVGNGSYLQETTYTDKLFMLSFKELGCNQFSQYEQYEKGYGEVYSYYSGHQEEDEIRIKKQVNDTEVCNKIEIPNGAGQQYLGGVNNYAGYKTDEEEYYGGYYWTRSPFSQYGNQACATDERGMGMYFNDCRVEGYGLAPGFCL